MKATIILLILVSLALADDNSATTITTTFAPQPTTTSVPQPTTTSAPQPTTTTAPQPTTTTRLPNIGYVSTDIERQMVHNCYHRRVWERLAENELTEAQLFCKGLAANSTDLVKSSNDGLARFASYRKVWDELATEKLDMTVLNMAVTIWKWNIVSNPALLPMVFKLISKEEKFEIEKCYFYRAWQSIPETQLTSHESFCTRVSTFKPNDIELNDAIFFLGQNKIWEAMPNDALSDFAHAAQCYHIKGRGTPDAICEAYYKRIENASSWRDIRLKELHECKLASYENPKGPRRMQCNEVIRDYKRIYLQME